uniref:Uncharacterized protein n=1 Tax=Cannabis sativa TaxID=3483 RepID=A0A803QNI5_CANSA
MVVTDHTKVCFPKSWGSSGKFRRGRSKLKDERLTFERTTDRIKAGFQKALVGFEGDDRKGRGWFRQSIRRV